jgi:hypothetical protein
MLQTRFGASIKKQPAPPNSLAEPFYSANILAASEFIILEGKKSISGKIATVT